LANFYYLFQLVRGQNGVYYGPRQFTANGYPCDFVLANVTKRLPLSFNGNGRVMRAAVISEGHGNFVNRQVGQPNGIETRPDEIRLAAEITPSNRGFFPTDDYNLDRPTDGFASIPEAVEDIRKGKVGGGENEMALFVVGDDKR
jgi:3,4-dihydroxy 2-butanone 4-phosphate synthase/GTP cyclohydrolase II